MDPKGIFLGQVILKSAFALSIWLCDRVSTYIQKKAEKRNMLETGIMALKETGALALEFLKEAALTLQAARLTKCHFLQC